MKPLEDETRHVFKMAEDEILLLLLLLFTHNFLITDAFISEICECSLTSTNTKGFFSEPGFVVEAEINTL